MVSDMIVIETSIIREWISSVKTFITLREFYYYESVDSADCLEHLISDKYWNGKDFYEVEAMMKWVDG